MLGRRARDGKTRRPEVLDFRGGSGFARFPPMPSDQPSPERPLTGGCLCGAVRYVVSGPFLRAGHCHCVRCRKHSGAAAGTQGRVRREDFRLVAGAERLVVYRPAPEAAVKVFCEVCGSSLFGGTWPDGDEISIRLGTVEGDPGIRPQHHTWVSEKAAWDEITDALPQHPEGLPPESHEGTGAPLNDLP